MIAPVKVMPTPKANCLHHREPVRLLSEHVLRKYACRGDAKTDNGSDRQACLEVPGSN
jgi:hypothetical protein